MSMGRRWHPSPLLQASFAVHAGAAAGLLLRPETWPWAFGALAANHGVLTAAGLWPRSSLLGPNWTRLPAAATQRGELALTIDDGPEPEVTPRVLDLLDVHGAHATFFLIGTRARRHAALVRDIVARGHAVENHSEHHLRSFSLHGPRWLEREIAAAQATLTEIGGQTPRFFRAPAGLRNPFLEPVLSGLDLQLAAWTRRGYDTRNGDPADVLRRLGCPCTGPQAEAGIAKPAAPADTALRAPFAGISAPAGERAGREAPRRHARAKRLAAGDILLLHDGNAATSAAGKPVILEVLPALLAACEAAGLKTVTLRSAIP